MTRIEKIEQKIESFKETQKELKKSFEKIIEDKKLPLVERWLLWESAPDALKEHDSWIHRGDQTKEGRAYERWIEGFDSARGGFDVKAMLEDYTYYVIHPEEENKYVSEHQKDIELIMEYVLKVNLGSFEWDW